MFILLGGVQRQPCDSPLRREGDNTPQPREPQVQNHHQKQENEGKMVPKILDSKFLICAKTIKRHTY